ncbi:MAG: winged helix-turn-helix domain-containing protein [Candidatus Woesearchaeota archaeon]
MRFTKITIVRSVRPKEDGVNDLLKWFGASLGLFSVRDKDSSCFRIFIVLVNDLKESRGYSSDEIAHITGLTRGTVIHHLNKLIDSGLVLGADGRYFLKVNSLEELVDEVKQNVIKSLDNLQKIGSHIDDRLGLK